MFRHLRTLYLTLVLIYLPTLSLAMTFPLPKGNDNVVGHVQSITVQLGQTIEQFAQEYQVGYFEFLEANPNLNLKDLRPGATLIIPTRFILPDTPHKGIVINLPELRLYYYPPNKNVMMTFPIGIGSKTDPTPIMNTRVVNKEKNPPWRPTERTREQALENGILLPRIIEPGPDNPLGDYAIRLHPSIYLIHGTNDPSGVGLRSSGGCIRMYASDIEKLFNSIYINTPVKIINEPYKTGEEGKILYLEVHVPLAKLGKKSEEIEKNLRAVVKTIKPFIKKRQAEVNWNQTLQVAALHNGIPEPVGQI